jgi:hypothetical protein
MHGDEDRWVYKQDDGLTKKVPVITGRASQVLKLPQTTVSLFQLAESDLWPDS